MLHILTIDLGTTEAIFSIVGAVATVIALFFGQVNIKLKREKRKLEEANEFNLSLQVLENFDQVWGKIREILTNEQKNNNNILIENIGLDLEKILPNLIEFIEKTLLENKNLNINYKGLIINPSSKIIEPIINGDSNIQKDFVNGSYKRLNIFKQRFVNYKNIQFDIKSYDSAPIVHGLMINSKYIFIGFTIIKNDKLFGADSPYLFLKDVNKNALTTHYFNFYNTWFNYYWNHEQDSKNIVN